MHVGVEFTPISAIFENQTLKSQALVIEGPRESEPSWDETLDKQLDKLRQNKELLSNYMGIIDEGDI